MGLSKRALAELIGTFWLVFAGLGSALISCAVPGVGIGYIGVSLAVGLTVLTMAYAVGHISGCHLNPAVTLGLVAAGRFSGGKDIAAYIIAQCIGGILAAAALFVIVQPDLSNVVPGTFATNGFSADGVTAHFGGAAYGMGAAFLVEAIMTAVFLLVIISATARRAPAGFAPIAIGLCLTLIHLASIPVTNTSVNPARSTAMALFTQGEPLSQLWLFWVAPILGAVIAGLLYKFVFEKDGCGCGEECQVCEVAKCEKVPCENCKCDKEKGESGSGSDCQVCEVGRCEKV